MDNECDGPYLKGKTWGCEDESEGLVKDIQRTNDKERDLTETLPSLVETESVITIYIGRKSGHVL